ncbi:hypothetical protein L3Q82_000036 [Scortum barcoo]|uniref:Uncharacterized protein n=1 Tax=Scortum barcoo TaxID=214431 RepID=A0ACB8XA58_9TELE|nr:hypothetical protein L3Q82_000036 [Scortum barcoo]
MSLEFVAVRADDPAELSELMKRSQQSPTFPTQLPSLAHRCTLSMKMDRIYRENKDVKRFLDFPLQVPAVNVWDEAIESNCSAGRHFGPAVERDVTAAQVCSGGGSTETLYQSKSITSDTAANFEVERFIEHQSCLLTPPLTPVTETQSDIMGEDRGRFDGWRSPHNTNIHFVPQVQICIQQTIFRGNPPNADIKLLLEAEQFPPDFRQSSESKPLWLKTLKARRDDREVQIRAARDPFIRLSGQKQAERTDLASEENRLRARSEAHHEKKNIKDRYVARIGVTGPHPGARPGVGAQQASAWVRVFAHGTRPGSARNGDVGPPSSRLTTRRKVHEGPVQCGLGSSRGREPRRPNPWTKTLAIGTWNVTSLGGGGEGA